MKAVLVRAFAPFEEARVEEVPDPEPGPGDVIVDVVAAEANYPDILVIEGRYQVKPPLPFSPGKAAAGRVAALGPGVTGLRLGDRVSLQVEYGAYAEKVRVRAEHCYAMPDSMSFDVAAALGLVYQTAHFALLDRAGFRPGDVVLVLGAAGGVGMASVQLAKALGARLVIGAAGPAKAAVAEAVGAEAVIDASGADLRDRMREEVARLTDGHGADIVIDPVGGALTTAALRALAWRGRLVVVGFASGEIPDIRANYLLVKNIGVMGLQWSDYRDRAPVQVAAAQQQIFDLHTDGKLDPHIGRKLPLERFKEALALLRDRKAEGKIILEVRPS
jgi:NADPH2:quinone reductase